MIVLVLTMRFVPLMGIMFVAFVFAGAHEHAQCQQAQ